MYNTENTNRYYTEEYTNGKYISGFGYQALSQKEREKTALKGAATGIGVAMLLFILSMNYLSMYLAQFLFTIVQRNYDFFTNILAREDIIQVILLIISVFSIAPAFMFGRRILGLKRREALPRARTSAALYIYAPLILLAVGLVGAFMTGWLSNITSAIFGVEPVMPENLDFPASLFGKVLYVVNMALVPGIFEEFAFRGVVMQALRKYGDGFALFVSSLLFGIAHGNMVQAPNAFLAGLVLGYFVLYTGNIKVSMFAHFVFNACSVLLSEGLGSLPEAKGEVFGLIAMGLYLVFGILALVLVLRNHPGIFHIKPEEPVSALNMGEKLKIFFTNPFILVILASLLYTTAQNYVAVG